MHTFAYIHPLPSRVPRLFYPLLQSLFVIFLGHRLISSLFENENKYKHLFIQFIQKIDKGSLTRRTNPTPITV